MATVIVAVLALFLLRACYLDAQLPDKTPEQLRQDTIESKFSAWDGAHINLKEMVINDLNDPESFEHRSTVYVDDKGSGLLIQMGWSALNIYGGRERHLTIAQDDLKGNVVITSTTWKD